LSGWIIIKTNQRAISRKEFYTLNKNKIAAIIIQISMEDSSDKNKRNAIDFYRMAYEGNPRQAVDLFVGSEYIQHNPLVGDGKDSFIEYFERMEREYPVKSIEFVRAVAEGNLVALHTHQVWPGDEEYVTMDFFRFDESGRIVEHWDAVQLIPENSANGHRMY
jgi:predicted SnoaL-like aldol condensation-catalyzing enzyme